MFQLNYATQADWQVYRASAKVALVAGTAGQWVERNGHYVRWERYVTGGVFIGLGVTAAFAGSDDAA